jgi:hypothetical protein
MASPMSDWLSFFVRAAVWEEACFACLPGCRWCFCCCWFFGAGGVSATDRPTGSAARTAAEHAAKPRRARRDARNGFMGSLLLCFGWPYRGLHLLRPARRGHLVSMSPASGPTGGLRLTMSPADGEVRKILTRWVWRGSYAAPQRTQRAQDRYGSKNEPAAAGARCARGKRPGLPSA